MTFSLSCAYINCLQEIFSCSDVFNAPEARVVCVSQKKISHPFKKQQNIQKFIVGKMKSFWLTYSFESQSVRDKVTFLKSQKKSVVW